MQESIEEESETCLGDPILDEDVGSFTILNEGDEAFNTILNIMGL